MFQNLSAGELLVLAFGGLLAIATIVSTIGGAVEKVVKLVKAARQPEQDQNDEIKEIKDRLGKLERNLLTDEKQINDARECNRVLTIGMMAMLEHGINGNNVEQMQKAKEGIEDYLVYH